MFSHVTVGTNDMAASRRFYDALFTAIGGRAGVFDDEGKLVYIKDGRMFMVIPPIDGEAACHANGGTIGFALADPQAVHVWQEAGVAHGGTAVEDPAGVRHKAGRQLYLAYLRDPDGNKLCAVHVMG
ncbi:VOC family protein [Stenotrophomonas indicatrix]|uniref:VOC family protein n=1 Tax=Stenotrophomonas indicatrix TaxID=2045451 RepID=UPI00341F2442